jgi:hypothetical protein
VQHAVEGVEEGDLDEEWDEVAEDAHAVGALHGGDFALHVSHARIAELAAFEFFLDGSDLGLKALRGSLSAHGFYAERKEQEVDEEGEDKDGPAPVGDDVGVDPVEEVEERLGKEVEEVVVGSCEWCCWSGGGGWDDEGLSLVGGWLEGVEEEHCEQCYEGGGKEEVDSGGLLVGLLDFWHGESPVAGWWRRDVCWIVGIAGERRRRTDWRSDDALVLHEVCARVSKSKRGDYLLRGRLDSGS